MPTRVLLLASRPERGRGLQRLTRLTAAAWRDSGASVHVLEHSGRLRAALRQAAAEAELVHLMDPRDAVLLPDNPAGTRVAVHCHDLTDLMQDLGLTHDRGRPHPLRRRQARLVIEALRGVDRVLATSRHTAEQVRQLTGRDGELMYPPVDPALSERPSRLQAWKPPAWPYLLTVGGPGRRERRDAAITAWAQLRRTKTLDGASLIIVGAPLTEQEDVQAMACGGHVAVLQNVTDAQLGALYQRSLAVLALGRPAGFVWPIAEAHQSGRPVLATDHSVFEETGQSGCVYLPVEGIDRFDGGTWASIADDLMARVVADRAAVNAERFAWRCYVDRLSAAETSPPGPRAQPAFTPAPSLPESVAAELVTATPLQPRWMPEVITLPPSPSAPNAPAELTATGVRLDPAAQERVPLAARG